MPQAPNNLRDIESLVEIVAHLRGPEGCPWDKKQTHETLTQYAIEETHELVEAIESPAGNRDQKMKEELGDVLFQVVLHAQLASERGAFALADVIETLNEKMIRRHPHVFGDDQAADADEVIRKWEAIKRQEKADETATGKSEASSAFALNVPPMPALQRAYKIGKRTEKLKFDWNNSPEAMMKVEEELGELREALDGDSHQEIELELGDVLFSLSQLARHLQLDPEQVLRKANRKFETRFELMVRLALEEGVDWSGLSLEDKDIYWVKAKNLLKKAP